MVGCCSYRAIPIWLGAVPIWLEAVPTIWFFCVFCSLEASFNKLLSVIQN